MARKPSKRTWTVEGVDAEAASMAKAAAEAAGMSVSDWLSKVILESTRPARAGAAGAGASSIHRRAERSAGAGAGADDDVDKARESLVHFLQAVIDDSSGRSRVIDEPELGDPPGGPGGELPFAPASPEVEINRESVVLPQGAVVFETARAAGSRDGRRRVRRPDDGEDSWTAADGAAGDPAGPSAGQEGRERPPAGGGEIIAPLIASDADFAELAPPKPSRSPAAMADAAADIGLVGLTPREAVPPAPADPPAAEDPSLPDWYRSEIVDDWTLRPETRSESLDLIGDEPIFPPPPPPPADPASAAATETEPEPAAGAGFGEPVPAAAHAERDEDMAGLPPEAGWRQDIPAGVAPTADQTWWERLEAEQKESGESVEPPAGAAAEDGLKASDLAVVRAMVAGEERLEPARRPLARWLLLLLGLAVIGGAAAAAWKYPDQLRDIRQRVGAAIAGDPAADRPEPARSRPAAEPGPGEAGRPAPDGEDEEAPVERLPLEGTPGQSSRAPAAQPAAPEPGPAAAQAEAEAPLAAPVPDGDAPPPPGPPEENILWYQRAASAGNAAAQTVLAGLYAEGAGVTQDYRKAAGWYRLAAAAGIADAQYALGELCEAGRGVPKDEVEAVVWYELAARQKHAQAEYRLGLASLKGVGTPINFAAARGWFERAARQGIPAAKYQLGVMHRDGLGVAVDNAVAFRWLTEAGQLGHRPAIQALRELMPKISGEDLLKAGEEMQQEDDGPAPASAGEASAAEPEPQVAVPPELDALDDSDTAIIGPAMPASGPPPSQLPSQIAAEDSGGLDGSRAKTIVIADPALVAEIQALLRRLNLMSGGADGRLTEETQQAIATYQRIAGLEPDGLPTPGLRDHLRKVLSGAGAD